MNLSTLKSKIGVIAGYGDLPKEVCRAAKKNEYDVALCAIKGEADPELESIVPDNVSWIKLGELGKLIKFFKKNNITEAILCGKIHKINILKGNVLPDLEMIKMLSGIRTFKDHSLLERLCNYLESRGVKIIDSTYFIKDFFNIEGVLTRLKPSTSEWEDVQFGFEMAKQIADLDIGQTVVVRNKSVVAVESIEGTDQAILRGGKLAEEGGVVVKVARPNQDMRFDVPTIGPDTLQACHEAKIRVLAFEQGKTILLHSEKLIDMANEFKIKLIAFEGNNGI